MAYVWPLRMAVSQGQQSQNPSKVALVNPELCLCENPKKKKESVAIKNSAKRNLSLGESNPGLPRLSVLMTSGNHHH